MNIPTQDISRRKFMALSAISGTAVVSGCATNPVSGRRQFMIPSESDEINLDKQVAPHQFSADYGAVQDQALNRYISDVGGKMAKLTHRDHMPYNFRVLNTVVVNGYTFPAGSIGLARGLMLSMENEAQLAAVLGHELGHVNWRHGSERMSKTMLAQLGVGLLAAWAETANDNLTDIAAVGGMLTSAVFLSHYSRQDEREADATGMDYMVKAGHNPKGMIGLMDVFVKLHKSKPNVVETLFSTHPMSDERYSTAVGNADQLYQPAKNFPVNRERYMDHTAKLRKNRGAIEAIQSGGRAMMKKKNTDAEAFFSKALKQAPDDYTGLLMMAKFCIAKKEYDKARRFAKQAKLVYPAEPQALHVHGMSLIKLRRFDSALAEFGSYAKRLPGNPET
ncbi:M48 family metalloprotease, partial [Verrucomicrobiota bacterium]